NNYFNANPTGWVVVPILSQPGIARVDDSNAGVRLTWQLSPRNKLSAFYDWSDHFQPTHGYNSVPAPSPEAEGYAPIKPERFATLIWKSPISSRLLVEAGVGNFGDDYTDRPVNGSVPGIISATEQTTGVAFRSRSGIGGYGQNI